MAQAIMKSHFQEIKGTAGAIEWNFNCYVDTCYSGSFIDKAYEWVEKNGGENETNGEEGYLEFFKNQTELRLEIFTSCTSEEQAVDDGEGRGGLWTNTFIAKGDFGKDEQDNMKRAVLTSKDIDDNVIVQHAQYYNLMVTQWDIAQKLT